MFRQLKIKTRILSILGALAGSYILLLAMVQISSTMTHRRMSEISSAIFPAALKMQEAEASFERMKKHYQDAVVLQDAPSLASAEKDAEATTKALEAVKATLNAVPEYSSKANQIDASFTALHARDHEVYGTMLSSQAAPTPELMSQVGALGKDNTAFSGSMSAFDKEIAAKFQTELDAVDAWSVRSRMTGLVMLLFAVVTCWLAWWVVQYKVVLPLGSLAMRMQDIAEGEGDLTARVEVNGDNEIDEVGIWFNVFISRIEEIIRRVADHAHTLGDSANDLEHIARATAVQARQQQEQAERITVTMSEMSTAVQEISETTQSAAVDARKAEESAKSGGEIVHATVETISELYQSNQETSARIEDLGRSSHAIGKIISVIDEIAAQTNLLALNASIEAARAGEQGRGFAVVAGEVRRLAERTSSATKEIDATVRAIQSGTATAVEAMRSSMSHVQSGVDSARSAGDELTSIIRGSENVQKMVTQIAAAATEQSYSTQSVSENVNEIATIIQQTATSSEHSVEACLQLTRLAGELTSLVGVFKVGREAAGSLAA